MPEDVRWLDLPIPLPAKGEHATFELEGERLLVVNAGGTPFVVVDECPHVRVSLAGGTLRGTSFECPMHGGRFDLRSGAPLALPIRKPATCRAVRREGERWQVGLPA